MLRYTIITFQVLLLLTVLPNGNPQEEAVKQNTLTTMTNNTSTQDDLKSLMQRYTAYNLWANQQFADWLSTASEEDMNKEIESSYKNLKETVLHIWGAEYLWLKVILGESYDNSPARNFEGIKEDLIKGWLEASQNFSDHIKTMSLEELQTRRINSEGDDQRRVVDIIQHCMNHSTYHRGQLITMGRQAGLPKPPRTDFLYYTMLFPE